MRCIKSWVSGILIFLLVFSLSFSDGITAYATDSTEGYAVVSASSEKQTYNFNIKYGQSEARSILAKVNSFRTGKDAWAWNETNTSKVYYSNLEPLQYDYGLEKIAMQRAAEIALIYGHTRPNGKSPFSAYPMIRMVGENIAAGQGDGQEVFVDWREDRDSYEGQGHRRNMLSQGFKYIGMGHVVMNGCDYWVQEFSSTPVDTSSTSALEGSKVVSIEISSGNIKADTVTYSPKSFSIKTGESVALPTVTETLQLNGTFPSGNKFKVYQPKVSYGGYDTGIIKVDTGAKKITGLKGGSTTLTLTVSGVGYKLPVTVTGGLAITKQPTDVSAKPGETATFAVTATGAKSYQWYYSKDKGKTWAASGMTGCKTNKLSVPVTEARIGQMYRCVVTGTDGKKVTSNAVAIKEKLAITKQPVNVTVKVGSTATFTLTATGAKSYQWYYSKDKGKTWAASGMTGNKTNKLSVPVTEARIGQMYKCVVTGTDGKKVTSNAVTIKKK